MKIALFQMDLTWESPALNRDKVHRWTDESAADADLVVLPEMFTTGFMTDPSPIAEPMDGETVSDLREMAVRTGKAFTGSIVVRDEKGRFFQPDAFRYPGRGGASLR